MKILKLSNMKGGWFVGGFEPTAYFTKDFEVSYKVHLKGEFWDSHYHTIVTEINLLIRGKMKIHDQFLEAGDIFILYPWEISNPIFVEDCEVICVKCPSVNDKKIIK